MTRQLRGLLDAAADGQVPDDLASAAVAGARQRRRNRYAVAGAIVGVLVLAAPVGLVMARVDGDARPAPSPLNSVAELPAQLPRAVGLPMLSDAPMDAASAVYIHEGLVVAINAETGEGAYIHPDLPSGGVTADFDSAEGAYLSPDGTTALLRFGPNQAVGLVDLAAGETTWVQGVRVLEPKTQGEESQVAWAPDSQSFACVCSVAGDQVRINVFDLADLQQDDRFERFEPYVTVNAAQVAWGTGGLAVHHAADCPVGAAICDDSMWDNGSWGFVDRVESPPGLIDSADLLALPVGATRGRHLAVRTGSPEQPAKCWIGWHGYINGNGQTVMPDGPVPNVRYEGGCNAASVGAAGDGFVMTMWSGDVVTVDTSGDTTKISQLPSGATSASFAADLLRQASSPTPTPSPSVPDQSNEAATFPTAKGLPTWDERPVEQASAAYLSDGQLVLVDAETGEGAIADLDVGPLDELHLSASGAELLWVQVPDDATGVVDSPMVRVNLAERSQTTLDLRVSANTPMTPVAAVASWDGSDTIYCLCGDRVGGRELRPPVYATFSPAGETSFLDSVNDLDAADAPAVDGIVFGAAEGPAVHFAAPTGEPGVRGWQWATTAHSWREWSGAEWDSQGIAMGIWSVALLDREASGWVVRLEGLGIDLSAQIPLPDVKEPFLTSAAGGGYGVVMVNKGVAELTFYSDKGVRATTIRPFAGPVAKLTVAGDWLAQQAPQ